MPDKPDPATFQFTSPKDGLDSWLIDAAIGLKFEQSIGNIRDLKKGKKLLIYTPQFSYHRNTLIDKEQFNWQTGLSITFANINRKPNDNLRIGHYATLSGKYSRNVIDTIQSFLLTGQYDIYRSGKNGINLGTNTYTQSPFLQYFSFTPSFQLQNNFKANNETLKGLIFRPQVTANYELATNLDKIQRDAKKKISLTLQYSARYDVANSTSLREYYTQLFKSALNLYLLNDPVSLAISGSFNYGSDPAIGLKKQQFWLIGVKLQK